MRRTLPIPRMKLQARTDGERYMQGLLLKWTKEQKEVHARDTSLLAAKSIRMVLPKGGETLHVCDPSERVSVTCF
jgi:hypothetical protein